MNTPRTPRDILLARHAASARPALDAQHDTLLACFAAENAAPASLARPTFSFREILAVLHRELFAPYRRAWSALACIWVALLAFQKLGHSSPTPSPAGAPAKADSALIALWIEQRRQLFELDVSSFGPPAPEASADGPSVLGRPSSPSASRPLGILAPASPTVAWA